MEVLLILMIITASISFVASVIISAIALATASGVKKFPNPTGMKSVGGLKVASIILFIINAILFVGFVVFLIAYGIEMGKLNNTYGYYYDDGLLSAGLGLLITYTAITFAASLLTLLALINTAKASAICIRMGISPVVAYAYQQPMYQQAPPQQYAPQPAQKKFCTACGSENLVDAKFCNKCGKAL